MKCDTLNCKNAEALKVALRRIFDAEGTVGVKSKRVFIFSDNEKDLSQVKILLEKVGIKSRVLDNRLCISGCENVKKFYEEIGFTVAHKQTTLEQVIHKFKNGMYTRYQFINWKQLADIWVKGEKNAKKIAEELGVNHKTVLSVFRKVLPPETYVKAAKYWTTAGLAIGRAEKWNRQLVIEELRRIAEELGKTPACSYDTKLANAAWRYFGTWNNAVKAAGLSVNRKHWNSQQVLGKLTRTAQRLGRTPASHYDRNLSHAAFRYFGSWNNAVRAAGLVPNKHWKKANPRFPRLCPTLAWLVMFIKGDGHLDRGSVSFGLVRDDALVKKLRNAFQRLFGLEVHEHEYSGYCHLRVHSSELSLWLRRNYGRFGTFKWNVPHRIIKQGNKKILKAAIKGIYDAEGTVSIKSKQVSISSVNKKALQEVKYLLEKIGINSWISGLTLGISGCGNVKKFYEEVGFTVTHRQNALKQIINQFRNGEQTRYQFIDWKYYAGLWLKGEKNARQIAQMLDMSYGTALDYLRRTLPPKDYTKTAKLWSNLGLLKGRGR